MAITGFDEIMAEGVSARKKSKTPRFQYTRALDTLRPTNKPTSTIWNGADISTLESFQFQGGVKSASAPRRVSRLIDGPKWSNDSGMRAFDRSLVTSA